MNLTYEEMAWILSTVRCDGPLPIVFSLHRGAWAGATVVATMTTSNIGNSRETFTISRNAQFTELPIFLEFMLGIHYVAALLWEHELKERLLLGQGSRVMDPHPELEKEIR